MRRCRIVYTATARASIRHLPPLIIEIHLVEKRSSVYEMLKGMSQ